MGEAISALFFWGVKKCAFWRVGAGSRAYARRGHFLFFDYGESNNPQKPVMAKLDNKIVHLKFGLRILRKKRVDFPQNRPKILNFDAPILNFFELWSKYPQF